MKKLFLLMSILLSTGMFFACSSDDEMNVNGGGETVLNPDDGVVLTPIERVDENNYFLSYELALISSFFNKELPVWRPSDSFFVDSDQDECYVINSLDELKVVYSGDKEIPNIDFNQYTLVMGQIIEPDFYYPAYKQELMFTDHKCHLTFYVPDFGPGYTAVPHFYYWALYPKFSTEGISVGYIKEKSVLKSLDEATGFVWQSRNEEPKENVLLYVSRIPDETVLGSDAYYPINLPDDFMLRQYDKVRFSGDIIYIPDDIQESLQLPVPGCTHYFIYLTNIEVID